MNTPFPCSDEFWHCSPVRGAAVLLFNFIAAEPRRPGAAIPTQLAKAHTFPFLTMIATWALIFAAFVYHPE
jgi:hypothetical protein